MKTCCISLISLAALLLPQQIAAGPLADSAWGKKPALFELLLVKQLYLWDPAMSAIDPEEARRLRRLYGDRRGPVLREREAILSEPADGRELVRRVLAPEIGEAQYSVRRTEFASIRPMLVPGR